MGRILLVVCGLLALVYSITLAIIAAAPWIALGIVVAGFLAWLWWVDYPADKKKPPE